MSQRECAGFNWPPSSIPAGKPVTTCPVAVSRAGWCGEGQPVRLAWNTGLFRPGSASGLHVAAAPGSFSITALSFPYWWVLPVASLWVGVGQPDSHATRPRRLLSGTFAHSGPSFQSLVVGVGHPVGSIPDVRGTDAR